MLFDQNHIVTQAMFATEAAPIPIQMVPRPIINQDVTRIYVGNIPIGTNPEDLANHFVKYNATLQMYKSSMMGFDSPYGFVACHQNDVHNLLSGNHQINGGTMIVQLAKPKVRTIKYFLDSRSTPGEITKLVEDQVRNYFCAFGKVTRVNLQPEKGIGFLDMQFTEDQNPSGLAWKAHDIFGQVIDVQESNSKPRKRKRFGGKGPSKRTKEE